MKACKHVLKGGTAGFNGDTMNFQNTRAPETTVLANRDSWRLAWFF